VRRPEDAWLCRRQPAMALVPGLFFTFRSVGLYDEVTKLEHRCSARGRANLRQEMGTIRDGECAI
jgi:hypothetical protein